MKDFCAIAIYTAGFIGVTVWLKVDEIRHPNVYSPDGGAGRLLLYLLTGFFWPILLPFFVLFWTAKFVLNAALWFDSISILEQIVIVFLVWFFGLGAWLYYRQPAHVMSAEETRRAVEIRGGK